MEWRLVLILVHYLKCALCSMIVYHLQRMIYDWLLKVFCHNKYWLWHSAYCFHNHRRDWSGYMQSATTSTSSNCWSQSIKFNCTIFRVIVHFVTELPKFSIKTSYITFDHPLYIKSFKISKSLQICIVYYTYVHLWTL